MENFVAKYTKLFSFIAITSHVLTLFIVVLLWMDFGFTTPSEKRTVLIQRIDELDKRITDEAIQRQEIKNKLDWLIRVNCAALDPRQRATIYVCD